MHLRPSLKILKPGWMMLNLLQGYLQAQKKSDDTVDHKILFGKPEHYRLRGIAKEWYCSYLANRKPLYRLVTINLQFRQSYQEFLKAQFLVLSFSYLHQ